MKGFGQHIVNQYEGSLDTGKFYSALLQKCYSKGVRILFGFEIKHIVGSQIVVNENYGELKAKRQVIVTTNAFANTLLDHKDILPARNQVFVTHPLPNINFTCKYFLINYKIWVIPKEVNEFMKYTF